MKSIRNILFVVVIVLVLAAQAGYLLTVYKDDKQKIANNKSEIASIEKRIAQLEERVKMLPETQKELELVKAKKMAMLNTIPTFIARGKESSELFRYLGVKDFVDVEIKLENNEANNNNEDELIVESTYSLKFAGRYSDVRDFINSLNASYQVVNVQQLTIDNSIQEEEEKKILLYQHHFGEDMDQLVAADLKMTMYTRQGEEDLDEIYQPDFDTRITTEGNFKRVKKLGEGVSPSISHETPEVQQPGRANPTEVFTLNIGDILTSGDTYKFDGPGPNSGGYVGLISKANTHITLEIRENGYEMTIEDEDGNLKQIAIDTTINEPILNIISTMRQVEDIMPNVHVYVYNYMDQLMNVELSGTLLENIYVFNEFDQQVRKGQTKGNIRLV